MAPKEREGGGSILFSWDGLWLLGSQEAVSGWPRNPPCARAGVTSTAMELNACALWLLCPLFPGAPSEHA